MFEKINSHNEWDKLKEIIVGSAEGTRATLTWNKPQKIPEKLLEEATKLAEEATPKWLYDEVCEDLEELSKTLKNFALPLTLFIKVKTVCGCITNSSDKVTFSPQVLIDATEVIILWDPEREIRLSYV